MRVFMRFWPLISIWLDSTGVVSLEVQALTKALPDESLGIWNFPYIPLKTTTTSPLFFISFGTAMENSFSSFVVPSKWVVTVGLESVRVPLILTSLKVIIDGRAFEITEERRIYI